MSGTFLIIGMDSNVVLHKSAFLFLFQANYSNISLFSSVYFREYTSFFISYFFPDEMFLSALTTPSSPNGDNDIWYTLHNKCPSSRQRGVHKLDFASV